MKKDIRYIIVLALLLITPFLICCAKIIQHQSIHIESRECQYHYVDSIQTATLHLVHLACTDDPSLGKGFISNIGFVSNLFGHWAELSNLKFSEKILFGEYANLKQLNKTIEELDINKNDVLVFYYSGHAINSITNNIWPNFIISDRETEYPNMLNLHEKLKEKKPKLLLNIADCCNYFNHKSYLKEIKRDIIKEEPSVLNIKAQQLLLKSEGDIIICSSSAGQYAYTERDLGGIFTNKLFNTTYSFLEENKKTNWHNILEKVSNSTQNHVLKSGGEQLPQYQINIK